MVCEDAGRLPLLSNALDRLNIVGNLYSSDFRHNDGKALAAGSLHYFDGSAEHTERLVCPVELGNWAGCCNVDSPHAGIRGWLGVGKPVLALPVAVG